MEYIDNVDSEGGPFPVADAEGIRIWRGAEEGSPEYEDTCQLFLTDPEPPGVFISVGTQDVLLWEPHGAGTGDVFVNQQGNIIIIRAWLDEPVEADTDDELAVVSALVSLPLNEPIELGTLEISSGVLAILWSPESGECIETSDIDSLEISESARPSGEMSSDSSGLLVRMAAGSYTCFHDEVELGESSARRCHIVKDIV